MPIRIPVEVDIHNAIMKGLPELAGKHLVKVTKDDLALLNEEERNEIAGWAIETTQVDSTGVNIYMEVEEPTMSAVIAKVRETLAVRKEKAEAQKKAAELRAAEYEQQMQQEQERRDDHIAKAQRLIENGDPDALLAFDPWFISPDTELGQTLAAAYQRAAEKKLSTMDPMALVESGGNLSFASEVPYLVQDERKKYHWVKRRLAPDHEAVYCAWVTENMPEYARALQEGYEIGRVVEDARFESFRNFISQRIDVRPYRHFSKTRVAPRLSDFAFRDMVVTVVDEWKNDKANILPPWMKIGISELKGFDDCNDCVVEICLMSPFTVVRRLQVVHKS